MLSRASGGVVAELWRHACGCGVLVESLGEEGGGGPHGGGGPARYAKAAVAHGHGACAGGVEEGRGGREIGQKRGDAGVRLGRGKGEAGAVEDEARAAARGDEGVVVRLQQFSTSLISVALTQH